VADKTPVSSEEEITRLKARVAELEAELHSHKKAKPADRRESARTAANAFSDASRNKVDVAQRMIRGMTLASLESVNLLAETVSAFATGVMDRSGRESESLRDMTTRLPGDIVSSFADAVDRAVDIPAKAAERYSDTYRQGQRTAPQQ